MPATLPSPSRIQIVRKILTCLALVLAMGGGLGLVLGMLVDAVGRGGSRGESWDTACLTLLYLGMFCVMVSTSRLGSRRQTGRVLRDFGPHPQRKQCRGLAAMWLLLAALVLLWSHLGAWRLYLDLSIAILVSFWLALQTGAVGHLQVTEHGIWNYTSLVRWATISSYYWADQTTLVVRLGPNGFFSSPEAIRVAADQRAAFEAWFESHLPQDVSVMPVPGTGPGRSR